VPVYLSIIIPCFNEGKRLPNALSQTIPYLKNQKFDSEIIVVNDGSTDETSQVAASFQSEFSSLQVIAYSRNMGKGYAVKKGMLAAHGEYRLFMDADLAVPVEYIGKILEMAPQHEIIIGSRGLPDSLVEKHQHVFREYGAKLFWFLQRIVTGLKYVDTQCGFKIFSENATKTLFPLITFDCAYFDTELLYIAKRKSISIGELGVRWSHDGFTHLPIGPARMLDLVFKLFKIRALHHES
jgi:glycosyltransferase involved in cell wall biosynthesis